MKSPSKTTVNSETYQFPSKKFFWLICFTYAAFMALMFQKLIVPLIPELHGGNGLMINDPAVFHRLASEIATKIKEIGWSNWELFPQGFTANLGLLSAIYALLGPDPAWFIPFNAAAHATGAVLLYRIGTRLVSGNAGKLGGLIAGAAYLIFPSALQWYGQNLKDAFAFAGILLVLDGWLDLNSKSRFSLRHFSAATIQAAIGTALLGLVRPSHVQVILLAVLASFTISATFAFLKRDRPSALVIPAQILFIAVLIAQAVMFSKIQMDKGLYGEDARGIYSHSELKNVPNWEWLPDESIPEIIDSNLRKISRLRVHFVDHGRSVKAGSEIDGNKLPNNSLEALAYMPRALFIGLFAPFPNQWGERVTAPRLVGAMETAVWYLFVPGILILLIRFPSNQLVAGLVFCACLIAILAYIHPNVGTLYRQRFVLWHFFMLCGSIGWSTMFLAFIEKRRHRPPSAASTANLADGNRPAGLQLSNIDRLAASGASVILVTMIGYLGFFARDLLTLKQLGVGDQLDAFFAALMIPMFFVTCMSMPIADALTLPFISSGNADSAQQNRLLRSVLGFAVILLGSVTLLTVATADLTASWVLGDKRSGKILEATNNIRWFSPIILLSAWTIVGNAALNALGQQRNAAIGQIIVPALTISALLFLPANEAIKAAIAGMLAGTLLNIVWVIFLLRKLGIHLQPLMPDPRLISRVTTPYRRLLIAAALPAALIPLNYAFAATVASGALSAWAFSSKVVVLFAGVASVGATAVVLPHLASLFTHERKSGVREDTYLLLVLGTWIGGLLAAGAFTFAEPIVTAGLASDLTQSQISDFASIIKIGALQLPAMFSGLLVTKIAIISGGSSRAMYSAALGFASNLLINILLVPHLGVLGVAIGALTAITLSTLALLISSYRQVGLSLKQLMTVVASWLIWAGACIAISSENTAVLTCAAIAIAGMCWNQFKTPRTQTT
jgi:peptidoglycan biosynthesis protein MviN/MurJ (putative lipid II flippase)